MAHLLIVARGLPSLVYPAVELARRLAGNHRVTLAADEETHELARRHGLGFLPLLPDAFDDFLQDDSRRSTIERLARLRRRRALARESLAVAGFSRDLHRVRPDLVLINGEMHAHIIAAVPTGVPVGLLNTFVSIWRRRGLPPPHHLARPGVGWRGTTAGMALLWTNLRVRKLRRRWIERVRHVGCDRLSMWRDLAQSVGFDRRELDDGQWLMPFTYRRLPVLSLHAREFEFPHRPPEHVHYVGPMILATRPDRATAGDRARLETLLARHRDGAGRRRLIYAGFGSVLSTDLAFLRRLLGIVERRPEWDLVLGLSGQLSPEALGLVPDRVHVFGWVPQLDVLAHADAAITHGGINSVDECVTHGVPVLVYCGGETDMAGTTSRVLHHGIGIAGDRQRDGTETIRGHIDRLIDEPGFRQRVGHLQRCYAAYAETQVAERTIDALLTRGAKKSRPTAAGSGPERG